MAEQYAHTLIAGIADFVPSSAQVQAFVSEVVARGVIPGGPVVALRTASPRTRQGVNPFTGQTETRVLKDHRSIDSHDRIADALAGLTDYELEVTGMGHPKTAPLPIDCDDPYHVTLTCHVSSKLRSLSDPDHSWGWQRGKTGPHYGELCDEPVEVGVFQNPHTGELIRVPGAGCARFWLEFELGKSIFPRIEDGNLKILNPSIVAAAEQTFGIPFAQGCYWA